MGPIIATVMTKRMAKRLAERMPERMPKIRTPWPATAAVDPFTTASRGAIAFQP